MKKYLIFTLPILTVLVAALFYFNYDTTGSEYSEIDSLVFVIPVVASLIFGLVSFINLLIKYNSKDEKKDKRTIIKQILVLVISVVSSFIFIGVLKDIKH